jgi:hypothetical protein
MVNFNETQDEVEELSIPRGLSRKLTFSKHTPDSPRGLKIQIAVVACFLLVGVLFFLDRPLRRPKPKPIDCLVGDRIYISSDLLRQESTFANEPSPDCGCSEDMMKDLLRAFRQGKADGCVTRTTLSVYESNLFQDDLMFQTHGEYLFEASDFEQVYAEHSYVKLPFRFISTEMLIGSGSDRGFRAVFKSETADDVAWTLEGAKFAYRAKVRVELIPFLYLDEPAVVSPEERESEETENPSPNHSDPLAYDPKNPDSRFNNPSYEYLVPVIRREDSTRSIQLLHEYSDFLMGTFRDPVKVRIQE